MKTFIVIPAYNEEKRIGKVIDDLKKNNYKNIIVIDDGSEDNTFNVAMKKKVTVLQHIINRGQGAALKTGIDYAIKKNADIIINFDADGQFLVSEISKLSTDVISGKADITLGSRFLGSAVNIPLLKKIVLKIGILVVFFLYGIKITDSQCGFRVMSKKAAQKIEITSDRMEHAGEIFHQIMKKKLKYKEIPVTIIYDNYSLKKGQSWDKSIDLGIKMFIKRLIG